MPRSSEPSVSIVIPARNEARNLEVVLPELPPVDQLVLVDGASVDDTVAVARRLAPDIVVVPQTRRGKGNALACGFAAASGDIVVMFDADGSADPAEIPAFLAALVDGGADFAKGTRFHPDGGSEDITALRRVGNGGLNGLTNLLFGTRFSDLCYGYNAFWRDIVPLLDLPPLYPDGTHRWGDGFEIETVLNCRVAVAGLKVVEVPSTERARIFGETNLRTFADGFRVLRTIVAEWQRSRQLRSGAAQRFRTRTRTANPVLTNTAVLTATALAAPALLAADAGRLADPTSLDVAADAVRDAIGSAAPGDYTGREV